MHLNLKQTDWREGKGGSKRAKGSVGATDQSHRAVTKHNTLFLARLAASFSFCSTYLTRRASSLSSRASLSTEFSVSRSIQTFPGATLGPQHWAPSFRNVTYFIWL